MKKQYFAVFFLGVMTDGGPGSSRWPVPAPVTPGRVSNGHVADFPASARPDSRPAGSGSAAVLPSRRLWECRACLGQACSSCPEGLLGSWAPREHAIQMGSAAQPLPGEPCGPLLPCSTQTGERASRDGVLALAPPDPAGRTAAAALSSEGHETDWVTALASTVGTLTVQTQKLIRALVTIINVTLGLTPGPPSVGNIP